MLGSFSKEEAEASSWHVSKFGVIPKQHKENKWRLIVDLSRPKEGSINDGIDSTLCLLFYTQVDEVGATGDRNDKR